MSEQIFDIAIIGAGPAGLAAAAMLAQKGFAAEVFERDAKAAARHVYVGLEKLDIDEEDLGEDVEVDAERVVAALQNVANKVDAE